MLSPKSASLLLWPARMALGTVASHVGEHSPHPNSLRASGMTALAEVGTQAGSV